MRIALAAAFAVLLAGSAVAKENLVTRSSPHSVKVTMDSPQPPPLGATVYVRPQAGAAAGTPVIKLPTSALRQDGQTSAVWVLDKASMPVRSQPGQIATADGNEAVIAGGLQPGMLVVAAGVHVLSPGQKVTIYQSNMPATQAAQAQAAPDSIAKTVPGAAAPVAK